jgi:hypothetical protein
MMKKTRLYLIVTAATIASITMYVVSLAVLYPMIASPDDANSSPLSDLIGFWFNLRPLEYYKLSGIREWFLTHFFPLVPAFVTFKSTRDALKKKYYSHSQKQM